MKNLIILTIFAFISCIAHAEELKIGIVDVNKILKDAPQTLSANKKLKKEFSSRTSKLKEKISALQSDEKKYQKESLTMSDDQRKKIFHHLQLNLESLNHKQKGLFLRPFHL